MSNKLNKRLQTARKVLKLTQEEMARKADISVDSISRYERGQESPSTYYLNFLYNELGINRKFVEEGQGEPLDYDIHTRKGKLMQAFLQLDNEGQDLAIRILGVIVDENERKYDAKEEDTDVD